MQIEHVPENPIQTVGINPGVTASGNSVCPSQGTNYSTTCRGTSLVA